MAKSWYVIHTQTGYEDRVKKSLESKIKAGLAGENISQVVVPIEQVSEVKAGFECGIGLDRFNDVKVGDFIEVFTMERVAATA